MGPFVYAGVKNSGQIQIDGVFDLNFGDQCNWRLLYVMLMAVSCNILFSLMMIHVYYKCVNLVVNVNDNIFGSLIIIHVHYQCVNLVV